MNAYCKFDMESWARRDLFRFYRGFDAPCFNISVKLKAVPLYQYAKSHHESFFQLSLYAILRASNHIPQMRHRIVDGNPVEFEKIAVMTPIMTKQEMFRQIWCEYSDTFAEFKEAVEPKIEKAKAGLPSALENHGEDFICASCTPWIHFESISQAEYGFHQTIPILTWGKMEDGLIPFSVKLNHCFVDGLHTANFFEDIQKSFSAPETLEH